MAEERSIIYNVDIKSGELTQQAAALTTEINKLKEEQKALAVAGKANTVEFQNNATQLRSLQREYKNTTVQLDNNVRATKAADGSYEELYNTTKLLEVQLKTLPNAFDKNNKEAQELTRQINLNKTALLGLNASIQDGRLNVGNYGNTVNGLKKRYAELQDQIANLDIGSDEFKKAQNEITKTRDALGLAQGKFDEFGETVKKGNAKVLSTFTDVGEGITAAFAIAPLFDESIDVQELQAKSLKAIAIAQNTVAIAKGISNAREAAGIIITKASTISTAAAAAVQRLFTTGVLTGTVALRAFKVALASTGIGLIIIALIELVLNFEKVTSAIKSFVGVSEEASKLTAKDYENMSEQAKKNSDILRKIIDDNIAAIEDEQTRRIEILKEGNRREIEELKAQASTDASVRVNANKRIAQIETLQAKEIAKINKEFADKDAKQREEEQKKRDQARKEAIKKAQDEANRLFEIQQTNQARLFNTQLEGVEKELALFDLQTKSQLREAEKRGEDIVILTNLRAKERQDIIDKAANDELEKQKEKDRKAAEIAFANQERRIKIENDGAAERLALFDLETEQLIIQSTERGEDLNLVEQERLLERNQIIKEAQEQEIKIKKEAAAEELAITEARATASSNLLGSFISSLTVTESASKKNAAFVKTLSASQATIQGFLAVQKALASAPPPLNFIEAAAVGITATANVAKILSAKPFARGGLTGKRITSGDGLSVRRSNGDNLLATVRTGEVILNERHQAALGGPRTFKSIGVPGFADGGFVNNQIQNEINATFNMSDFEKIMNNVRPVVSVQDINTGQNRVQAIDELTKL